MIFTSSWDGTLKIWSFQPTGLIQTKSLTLDCAINTMVFISSKENLILGLQNGTMVAFNNQFERGSISVFTDVPIIGLE